MHVETQDVLEVREPIVAAEAHVVAEEGQHEGVGQGLGDDREVDAGDARSEGEPPEDERQEPRHQDHHEHRDPEPVEGVPVPGQLRPVQEHHEVRQYRVAIDPARADLAHEIHAHGIAPQREEGTMPEAHDPAIAPDEVEGHGQERIGQVFTEERDRVGREVQRRGLGNEQVQDRDYDDGEAQDAEEDGSPGITCDEPEHALALGRPALLRE
jgi:hypothetical protein